MKFVLRFTGLQFSAVLILALATPTWAVPSALPDDPGSSTAKLSAAPLTYSELTKRIGAGKGDDRAIAQSLVGRSVVLRLRRGGPQALMVNAQDGVYFTCRARSTSFRGGTVRSTIAAYAITPNGDVSIELERCGH